MSRACIAASLALLLIAGFLCGQSVLAQTPVAHPLSQPVLDGARADIEAAFEVDRKACVAMSGNAGQVCIKQARWREQVSLARLDFIHRGNEESRQRLLQLRYEMRYEVSLQRCSALSPQARRHCLKRADLEREQAREALASHGPLPDLLDEQQTARRRADREMALSRCEAMKELARDICIASAQARYGEP